MVGLHNFVSEPGSETHLVEDQLGCSRLAAGGLAEWRALPVAWGANPGRAGGTRLGLSGFERLRDVKAALRTLEFAVHTPK